MIRKLAIALLSALSALIYYMFYQSYFKWHRCFNESGRCFDPEEGVVYLEQSGIGWLALALATTALLFYQLWRIFRR